MRIYRMGATYCTGLATVQRFVLGLDKTEYLFEVEGVLAASSGENLIPSNHAALVRMLSARLALAVLRPEFQGSYLEEAMKLEYNIFPSRPEGDIWRLEFPRGSAKRYVLEAAWSEWEEVERPAYIYIHDCERALKCHVTARLVEAEANGELSKTNGQAAWEVLLPTGVLPHELLGRHSQKKAHIY